jgi:hypothetical protein
MNAVANDKIQLFLQFHGPVTLLLQSRASRVSDTLTSRDVNEIADSPPGAVQSAVTLARKASEPADTSSTPAKATPPTSFRIASVKGGKVTFEDATKSNTS